MSSPPQGRRLAIGYGDSIDNATNAIVDEDLRAQLENIQFGSSMPEQYTPNTSLLMALPREIHNSIFQELWKLHPVTRTSVQGATVALHYDNPNVQDTRDTNGMPTWLLTNKAFFHEGREQFRLKSTWTFDYFPTKRWIFDTHTDSYVAEFRSPSLKLPNLSKTLPSEGAKKVAYKTTNDTSLLDISTVRELTFQTQNPSIHAVKIFTISFEDREHMHRIVQTLQAKPSNLKVFRLSTHFKYKEGYADPKTWIVNLS